MLESSPTIHEELGRLRHANRFQEADERHSMTLAVEPFARAGLPERAGGTLRRVHDAVATGMHASRRHRPTTPVTHH